MARRFVALMLLLLLVIVVLIVIWYLGSQKTVRVELFAGFAWLPRGDRG